MDFVLSVDNKRVLDRINKIENNLDKTVDRVIQKVAKKMVQKAQRTYNNAEYDGTNDVYVYSVRTTSRYPNGISYKVVAEGSAVLFIEFGAGIKANRMASGQSREHPYRQKTIPPMNEIGWYGADKYWQNKNWAGSKGMGFGENEVWVFHNDNITGKTTPDFAYVMDKNFRVRKGYYWTAGNKPARAMYYGITLFYRELPKIALEEVSKI